MWTKEIPELPVISARSVIRNNIPGSLRNRIRYALHSPPTCQQFLSMTDNLRDLAYNAQSTHIKTQIPKMRVQKKIDGS